MDIFDVPVIDIGPFVDGSGDKEARAQVIAAVSDAAESLGFMQVRGHAISTAVITGLQEAMDWFFLQLESDKRRYVPSPGQSGYVPPRTESLSASLGVATTDGQKDYFEAYDISRGLESYPGLALPAENYPSPVWPDDATFKTQVSMYFDEAGRVSRLMMDIFCGALGLESHGLDWLFDHSIEALRMNHFALPEGAAAVSPGPTAMGQHTDFGLVTVLWADPVPGLQILEPGGHWVDVQPADGALLINIGDLMARLTNDRWLSTLHRVQPPVVNGQIMRRRSAALFLEGNADAVVTTLQKFVPTGTRPRYPVPIVVGKHSAAKYGGVTTGTHVESVGSEVDRALKAKV